MARDPRGPYLTPYRKQVLAMIEDAKLSHFERLFLVWLVFAVDPGTRRLDGVTLTGLAEVHHVKRTTMRSNLERLRADGSIDYQFRRRTTGWVKLCCYDQIVAWTPWLGQQRRKAVQREHAGESVPKGTDNGDLSVPKGTNSAGKTPEAFLTLLDVSHDDPEPLAWPTNNDGGSCLASAATGTDHARPGVAPFGCDVVRDDH